jgi:uncharacterized protein involved in exopolysaccharide biosynthesis
MNRTQGVTTTTGGPTLLEMTPLEHIRHVKARWRFVSGIAFLVALLGVGVALILDPVYQSNATIRPRESGQNSLLGLGNLTGQASSQLTKLEGSFKSRDLALDVLDAHPEFLGWLYPKEWDSLSGTWKNDEKSPSRLRQAGALQKKLTVKTSMREGTLFAQTQMNDPTRAQILLATYLERLNYAVRQVEKQDADSNRAFMERELLRTEDPILRVKMQSLISAEIDRSYLVRNRAFEVVEAPAFFEQKMAPNRRKIVLGFFGAGILFGVGLTYFSLGAAFVRTWIHGGRKPE